MSREKREKTINMYMLCGGLYGTPLFAYLTYWLHSTYSAGWKNHTADITEFLTGLSILGTLICFATLVAAVILIWSGILDRRWYGDKRRR